MFKVSPTFLKAVDRIKFFEVPVEEILRIYSHVHEEIDYEYDIKVSSFKVQDWLDFYDSAEVQRKVNELLRPNAKRKMTNALD